MPKQRASAKAIYFSDQTPYFPVPYKLDLRTLAIYMYIIWVKQCHQPFPQSWVVWTVPRCATAPCASSRASRASRAGAAEPWPCLRRFIGIPTKRWDMYDTEYDDPGVNCNIELMINGNFGILNWRDRTTCLAIGCGDIYPLKNIGLIYIGLSSEWDQWKIHSGFHKQDWVFWGWFSNLKL